MTITRQVTKQVPDTKIGDFVKMEIRGGERLSVTGSAWKRDSSERNGYMFGCIHNTLEVVFPEAKRLIRWHLFGMHYTANAIYWRELCRGESRWKPERGQDPFKILHHHIAWGLVESESIETLRYWVYSDNVTPDDFSEMLRHRLGVCYTERQRDYDEVISLLTAE
jgi:hypothetical protein